MPGILFVRTSPTLLVFGLIIGALNFRATESFRRRAGVSPWRIHPVIWALASVFVNLIVTVLAVIAIRTTKAPGGGQFFPGGMRGLDEPPRPTRGSSGPYGSSPAAPPWPATTPAPQAPGPPAPQAPGLPASAPSATTSSVSPPSWHPDPSGVHHYRYWDGTTWTEHVSTDGVGAIDPPPTA